MPSFLNRIQRSVGTFKSFVYPRDLWLVIGAFSHRRYSSCPPELWQLIEPIGGFMRPREAGLLYWAATQWPSDGPVLELGSYEGRSTILFARAGRYVHAIDAWDLTVNDLSAYEGGRVSAENVFDRFQENMRRAQVESRVRIHRGLTRQIAQDWSTPGALLYVDAGHTYEDVKNDLKLWTPFLIEDGLLILHDVIAQDFPGIKRATSELLQKNWRIVASADSVVVFCRK